MSRPDDVILSRWQQSRFWLQLRGGVLPALLTLVINLSVELYGIKAILQVATEALKLRTALCCTGAHDQNIKPTGSD